MANVIIYAPNDPVVNNRVLNYLTSVNTPDYTDRPDTVINPDLSQVVGLDIRYWQVDGNKNITPMDVSDRTSVDDFYKAKTLRDKKYQVVTYNSIASPMAEAWYDQTDGSGGYSGLVETTNYVYDANALLSRTITTYYYDGTAQSGYKHSYFKNDAGQTIEKIEEI